MMVASGKADFWIEPTASPWDLAPLQIIIEEAGGKMFGFDGARGIYGGNCVACAPVLRPACVNYWQDAEGLECRLPTQRLTEPRP
jgi:histidinol-phosphatase